MLINKDIEYAVLGLLDLASHPEERRTVRQMAEAAGLPQLYLSKIFQQLSRACLVHQRVGPKGGFSLGLKPADISLTQIFLAVDPEYFVGCARYEAEACTRSDCRLRGLLCQGEQVLRDYFTQKTLIDLMPGK